MSRETKYRVIENQANSAQGAIAVNVTGQDHTFTGPTRWIYVGGAGSGALKVLMADGNVMSFAGLAAGTLLPISVTKVYDTGTDVTNIVALF